jgi:hypothetical protein
MPVTGERRPRGHGVTAPGDSMDERRRKWLASLPRPRPRARRRVPLDGVSQRPRTPALALRRGPRVARGGERDPSRGVVPGVCAGDPPGRGRSRGCSPASRRSPADTAARACRREYVNSQSHLRWRCADGHEWDAVPGSIAMGTWCPHCAGRAPLTIADMHEMARDRGGQCLSRTYHNTQDALRWRCAEGHEWSAQPTKLRQGSWCPRCSERARHTIDDVQAMAAEHGGECLSVPIDGSLDVLRFRCRVGHLFESNANRLQQGHWCPRCRQMPRGNVERLQQAVSPTRRLAARRRVSGQPGRTCASAAARATSGCPRRRT